MCIYIYIYIIYIYIYIHKWGNISKDGGSKTATVPARFWSKTWILVAHSCGDLLEMLPRPSEKDLEVLIGGLWIPFCGLEQRF